LSGNRLVYSTSGDPVPHLEERSAAARRTKRASAPSAPADGVVRLFRERGGRGGKVVTVVRGLPGGEALDALAAQLKRFCGAGGTVKGDILEIQGDHRERLAERLRTLGHPVKLAGG
jgi:translation initiation factor 1